jgi:hypothetical protein
MTHTSTNSPDVFSFYLSSSAGCAATDLEAGLRRQAASFTITSRPYLDPAMFSHRILRAADGALAWEISFRGLDLPGEEQAPGESLEEAIVAEVRARIAGLGEITGSASFTDVSAPPPSPGFRRILPTESGPAAFVEDASDWLVYAADSGAGEAGTPVDASILETIAAYRADLPAEPGLKKWGAGHMYGGNDKAHVAYLASYLAARAERASAADKRKILAFAAFQAREGSTAAINTYDNQIVTWGTGWGGLGWLGKVMERATANDAVRDRFGSAGLGYRKGNVYDAVDSDTCKVVTGKSEALEVIRRSVPLLYLLIDVARAPATRDAVTEAQLLTFMEGSGNISGAELITTQALFNLVAHLKHWAPGYVMGVMEWAAPQLCDMAPSADRDRALAVLVGRYFYGKANKTKWIPAWKQFQIYFGHMKSDGLDCLSDPFIQASAAPADDPFVAHPITTSTPVAAAPAASPVLTRPPLAGQAELERVARGQAALRRGARGEGVKALQQAFIQLGITVPGGADGAFGPGLEQVVKAFQTEGGLGADGVVGRGTLATLDARLAAAKASD